MAKTFEELSEQERAEVLKSFLESRQSRSTYNTARRKALADLAKAHDEEFKKLLKKHSGGKA